MKLGFLLLFKTIGSIRLLLAGAGLLVALPLSAQELVLYSGRSKALVDPIIEAFEAETGIRVLARFGGTPQLAIALQEEGRRSRADLFWAQDAGALGSISGLLQQLPFELTDPLDPALRNENGNWVATSGRARVLTYSSTRVDAEALPDSLQGLTDRQWRGRVGWAPSNGSFQSFITAMRQLEGEAATREWLSAMRANNTQAYPNNSSLLQAIAAGEIDMAITNHYYLYRFQERDPNFPVAQQFFTADSTGNLVNYAGIGLLATSRNSEEAKRFIRFLLDRQAQQYFSEKVFEYPVRDDIDPLPGMATPAELQAIRPEISLDSLEDLQGTIRLLREVNLL
ncbi:MAG: iron ABC transporter substrate-binding protein [Opitutales bacterium]|nr:iron ABC transporter substrate-binding protein [Opitutales bacterium]